MSKDTGHQLRSLYESQGGVRGIFSSKVADYSASRPAYPPQMFDTLQSHCQLDRNSLIADLGAGTGLLTMGFLERGFRVIAVEPNAEMRSACDQYLGGMEGYRSVEGCAEAIPLEAGSVDLITAAQAFHWFEVDRARAECLRVLGEDGQVALIWNTRLPTDPLQIALEEVCARYGGEKRSARLLHDNRSDIPKFFGSSAPVEFNWPNNKLLDKEGLISLVLSLSYMPERTSAAGQEVCACIREIFDENANNGSVVALYTTVAIVGRPK